MKKLILAIPTLGLSLWSAPTGAQAIPPPTKRAARVEIREGPSLRSFGSNNQAIISWTSNNPGGSDEHFGVVYFGTHPNHLSQMAKGHIRLNRTHSYTVFRVRLLELKPGATYYYKVDSTQADGTPDGVNSAVYRLDTPSNP
jgi:Purple acid Phosphatase, N-terminal domain